MQQIGIVKEIREDFAVVEVSRKSACEGCHANADGNCSACVSFGDRAVVCRAENSVGAKAGDRVMVETRSETVLLYAASVFLFPLILGIIGYVAASLLPFAAAPYISAVLGFALAFVLVIFTLNRRASRRLDVKIIKKL